MSWSVVGKYGNQRYRSPENNQVGVLRQIRDASIAKFREMTRYTRVVICEGKSRPYRNEGVWLRYET